MPWHASFDQPVPLPDGRALVTLTDARAHILKLPKADQDSEAWQTAIEALLMAAEGRGPIMHARIGVIRALNHGAQPPAPRIKRARKMRIIR